MKNLQIPQEETAIPNQIQRTLPTFNNYQPIIKLISKYLEETTVSNSTESLMLLYQHFADSEESKEYDKEYISNLFFELRLTTKLITNLYEEMSKIEKV